MAAIDPTTGLPPTDPLVGFLAPGQNGNVSLKLLPQTGLATGAAVSNQATITFDKNPSINTPTWSNTIDNAPPVSHISALATQSGSLFTVQWAGTDVGAGVQSFTIYISDSGGAFVPWLTQTTSSASTYNGQVGHTYRFYSIAQDLVGNIERAKTLAEATTQVIQASPVPPGELLITASGLAFSRVSQTFTGTVKLQNLGRDTISGPFEVLFTALTGGVTLANASGTFNGNSYLTLPSLTTLAPDQSAVVNVQFRNPSNATINFTPVVYSGSLN